MKGKLLLVLICLGLLIVSLNSATNHTQAGWQRQSSTQDVPEDLIRLHVIANSDSPEDQAVKLRVRDAVLVYLKPILAECSTPEQAIAEIGNRQQAIRKIANQVLGAQGMPYQAQLEIGRFDFPVRSYGQMVVPAGEYQAVRLLLGQASGRNWWCVLFPPLCFIDINTAVTAPPAEEGPDAASQEKPKIELRWKIAEWWNARN